MKNKLKYILLFGVLFIALNLNAQNQSDIRINEILVTNTSDFQDDFGQHSAWIELFNTSYGTVDIGGCFITNDPNNLKKYIIPKGDVLTKIKPRQHALFWADNQPFRGTFHVNFTLIESDEILFVSSDGRTIIDRIKIPKDLQDNTSYGRKDDGKGSCDGSGEGWGVRAWTSPSTNNSGVDAETKSMIMKRTDPSGWIMSLIAMSVVFISLIILYFSFKLTGYLSVRNRQKKSDKAAEGSASSVKVKESSAESFAAIAMALSLYAEENESHDDESLVITIQPTESSYSPWNSKIYGLRHIPTIKK